MMAENDKQQRRLHYQERTSISDFIEDSTTAEDDDLQKNDVDDELALIEKAFNYLTRKTYSQNAVRTIRVIRRKAEKLEERNEEIFYKKRGRSTVSVTEMCMA